MASPILLVCDDLATVATVKRVLGREGYEVVLATNSADAVIAFGHHLPGLVLLDPAVEGDRGQIVLEELQSHPDGKLLKLMLLGESIPGFGYPMAGLPIEADAFLPLVEQTMRGPGEEPWQVFTSPRAAVVADPEAVPAARPLEPPDQWRTTQRLGESFVRRPGESAPPEAPVPAAPALPPEPKPSPADLESALFGDLEAQLQREVEAEATKTVETSLAAMRDDDELLKLEEEVRAEAARRRQARRDSQTELPAATGPEETLRGGGPLRTRDDEAPPPPAPLPGDTISEPGEVPAEDEALRAVGRALAAEKAAPGEPRASEQSFAALDAAPTPMPAPAPTPARPEAAAALAERAERAAASSGGAGLFDGVPPTPPKSHEALPGAGPEVAVSLERAEAIAQAAELDARARAEVSESALDALRRELGAKDELLAAADQGREAATAERDALAAKLAATERALAELKAELELFQTELSATQQRATGAERQLEELQKAKGTLEAETRSLWTEYERLEKELADARASLAAERELRGRDEGAAAAEQTKLEEQLSALGAELATVRGDLENARREATEQVALLREAARALERDKALAEKEWRAQVEQLRLDGVAQEEAIGAVRGQLAQEREARATLAALLEKTQADARTEAERAVSEASALARAELDSVRAQLDVLQTRLTEADAVTARLTAERDGARDLVLARERELEVALAQGEAARAEADAARENLARAGADFVARQGALEAQLAEVQKAQELLRQNVQTLQDALERAQIDRKAALEQQERLRSSLDKARSRAQELEGRATQAEQVARAAADRAEAVEARTILALPIPERPPLGVKKFGSVDLAGLARLVGQLVLARAEVRLELGVTGGRRTLWLRNGSVVAAESSFVQESLIDRARRDGLIDARQERDLQPARTASAHEALVILKGRGFLREAEGPPLVQRHTEAVALDALSEAQSEYRLTEEPPGPEVLAARLPRPTLPLLAEAVRRALPTGELLEKLGGGEAVPFTADGELDPRALGFGDKERRMLGYVDGEATVEDLTLASGLTPEAAWRGLLVAKLLGVIDLKVPEAKSTPPTLELEVQRLADKFEQVQEADYFTVLGLPRSAGTDEVRRAFDRLAEEFDPVRYSGHPDAGLQQRAQVVFHALEEAAQALRDERRRADYARHLVD